MKTIKIIDLLIMVANNEELPKRIMFLGNTYRYDEIDKTYRNTVGNTNIGEMHNLEFYLNDEVEIIEEDKEIRKLPPYKYEDEVLKLDLAKKIDELTEAINELKKGK